MHVRFKIYHNVVSFCHMSILRNGCLCCSVDFRGQEPEMHAVGKKGTVGDNIS